MIDTIHPSQPFSIRLPKLLKHDSIAEYLRDYFPFLDHSVWAAFIAEDRAYLNGAPARLAEPLAPEQLLTFSIRGYSEPLVDTQWSLLWDSEQSPNSRAVAPHGIIAVHKPHGLAVSRTTRHVLNNLQALVQAQTPWPEAQLLHRLDADTGGIVLLAKNKESAKYWQPKLAQLMVQKTYWAIVHGCPKWEATRLRCKLGKKEGSEIRSKMYVVEEHEKGKHSDSEFRVLALGDGFSLIECQLHSGRKHQLRAHLSHLGHPIVGDKIYANNGEYYLRRLGDQLTFDDEEKLMSPAQLLFARELVVNTTFAEGSSPQGISLYDPKLGEAWQGFCARYGLPLEP